MTRQEMFLKFKDIVLERYGIWKECQVRFATALVDSSRVDPFLLAASNCFDAIGASMMAYMTAGYIKKQEVRVPVYSNWFEHARAEILPDFINKRFPPKMGYVMVVPNHNYNVCPHKNLDDISKHIEFLMGAKPYPANPDIVKIADTND